MNLKRKVINLYGKPQTIIKSISITVFIIYYIFIFIFNDNLGIQNICMYYNSDISSVSGTLAGFVFATFGILMAIDNEVMRNLKLTNNIKCVNKLLLNSVIFFIITLIIYFLKDLIIYDYNSINNFTFIRYTFTKSILLFGLYSFVNAFVLFLFSLFAIKKILLK